MYGYRDMARTWKNEDILEKEISSPLVQLKTLGKCKRTLHIHTFHDFQLDGDRFSIRNGRTDAFFNVDGTLSKGSIRFSLFSVRVQCTQHARRTISTSRLHREGISNKIEGGLVAAGLSEAFYSVLRGVAIGSFCIGTSLCTRNPR
jgi:hypothetical protein